MPSPKSAPPEFAGVTSRPEEAAVDLLFIPVFEDEGPASDLARVDAVTGGERTRATTSGEFKGKSCDMLVAQVVGSGWKAARIAFVGAGKRGEADAHHTRRLGAASGYLARQRSAASIAWLIRGGLAIDLIADGLSAAEFFGGTYKAGPDAGHRYPRRVEIIAPGADAATVAASIHRGRVVGRWANFTRELANEPGNVLTPREFAARVAKAASDVGLGVETLDEPRIRDLDMRLLLAVSQGSAEPPRVIVLRHDPPGAPASPVLAFVGKGVTFDSGGISIKPADGMDRMKDDMSGGAAVAGALCALATLGVPVRVIGIIPTVENMPGGRATRPGDVIQGASGKTVEIINTDAEGRLILADALWYARELGATHLVDIATLTGACIVALGRNVTGLFGRPDTWTATVRDAAARGGDRLWTMPIYEEAVEELRSEIADIANAAGRQGGAITAAAFLREFAGDLPWVHLDIAGPAWAESKKSYQPKGATGVAVRTLIEIAKSAAGPDRRQAD
jgi:leucyl aminopeptidase